MRGYPIWGQDGGYPHLRSGWGVPPFQVRMGSNPIPGQDWGVPPFQVRTGVSQSQFRKGGYIISDLMGVPHPRSGWGGGTPISGQDRGVPHLRSDGGYSHSRSAWGFPILPKGGYPYTRSQWGYPLNQQDEVPPCPGPRSGRGWGSTLNWNSTACTYFAAGGMPLAFTQEYILVFILILFIIFWILLVEINFRWCSQMNFSDRRIECGRDKCWNSLLTPELPLSAPTTISPETPGGPGGPGKFNITYWLHENKVHVLNPIILHVAYRGVQAVQDMVFVRLRYYQILAVLVDPEVRLVLVWIVPVDQVVRADPKQSDTSELNIYGFYILSINQSIQSAWNTIVVAIFSISERFSIVNTYGWTSDCSSVSSWHKTRWSSLPRLSLKCELPILATQLQSKKKKKKKKLLLWNLRSILNSNKPKLCVFSCLLFVPCLQVMESRYWYRVVLVVQGVLGIQDLPASAEHNQKLNSCLMLVIIIGCILRFN